MNGVLYPRFTMLLTLFWDQLEQPWSLHSRTLSVGQTNDEVTVEVDALLTFFPSDEENEDDGEEEGFRMRDQI